MIVKCRQQPLQHMGGGGVIGAADGVALLTNSTLYSTEHLYSYSKSSPCP